SPLIQNNEGICGDTQGIAERLIGWGTRLDGTYKRNIANDMHGFWRLEALSQVFRNTFTDGDHPATRVQGTTFDNLKEAAFERRMGSIGVGPPVIRHVLRIPLVKITYTGGSLVCRGNQGKERCGQIVGMVSPSWLPHRGS